MKKALTASNRWATDGGTWYEGPQWLEAPGLLVERVRSFAAVRAPRSATRAVLALTLALAGAPIWTCEATAQATGGEPRPVSVIVLDLEGDGVRMSNAAGGVDFDVDLNGKPVRVGWTTAGTDDAFLVMDNNGNGKIDDISEMVGTRFAFPGGARPTSGAIGLMTLLQGITLLPNGDIPRPIPPGSGVIDKNDRVYSALRLWIDVNHNGVTDPGELQSLADGRVSSISNGYRAIQRAEPTGNVMSLEGYFLLNRRGVDVRRPDFEVRLAR